MNCIIGLGNPGSHYRHTRHNVGFLFLENFRDSRKFPPFREESRFEAETSEGIMDRARILLMRPLTFMNRSGDAVVRLAHFYKLNPHDIAVIHDDLDIAFGKIRISRDSRSAGHRGVEDIIKKLGTKTFLRIRIGIRREAVSMPSDTAHFVLERFTREEKEALPRLFQVVADTLAAWVAEEKNE